MVTCQGRDLNLILSLDDSSFGTNATFLQNDLCRLKLNWLHLKQNITCICMKHA